MRIKRTLILIVGTFLAVSGVVGLTGCGSETATSEVSVEVTEAPTDPPTDPPTPIDEMNSTEEEIYNMLIKNINDFKDPTSVRVLTVTSIGGMSSTFYEIEISAANSFGAMSSDWYWVSDSGIYDFVTGSGEETYGVEPSKINVALSYYWEEQGF